MNASDCYNDKLKINKKKEVSWKPYINSSKHLNYSAVSVPWNCTHQPELVRNKNFRSLRLLISKEGNLSEERPQQVNPL